MGFQDVKAKRVKGKPQQQATSHTPARSFLSCAHPDVSTSCTLQTRAAPPWRPVSHGQVRTSRKFGLLTQDLIHRLPNGSGSSEVFMERRVSKEHLQHCGQGWSAGPNSHPWESNRWHPGGNRNGKCSLLHHTHFQVQEKAERPHCGP